MAKRDYYEVLGIDRSADEAALKKAYRSLAMQYHPDRNPGNGEAAEKMKEVNEAYAVLNDPQKRQVYDTYGHAGLEGYSQEDIFGGVDFSSIFRESGLGDLFGFGNIFGGRTTTRDAARKGADLRYDLTITLEEAAFGTEKTLELPLVQKCPACKGTGAESGGVATCGRCGGNGQIIMEQRSGYSVFRQISVCPTCRGAGRIVKSACKECKGKGVLKTKEELKVSIPAGVDTGNMVKLPGKGEVGEDRPGDLYIVVNVAKHPVFERHDNDIYMRHEVSMTTAALGGEMEVPGLDGELKLDVPEGTQTGTVLRILGRGIPHYSGSRRGDFYVVVKVATPVGLNRTEKELLREFAELHEQKHGKSKSVKSAKSTPEEQHADL